MWHFGWSKEATSSTIVGTTVVTNIPETTASSPSHKQDQGQQKQGPHKPVATFLLLAEETVTQRGKDSPNGVPKPCPMVYPSGTLSV